MGKRDCKRRSRRRPRPSASGRPADRLTDLDRCLLCPSRKVIGGGLWAPRGIARSVTGRSIIPYALCRPCFFRPGRERLVERAIVRRAEALARGEARAPGESPAAIVIVSRIGGAPIPPGVARIVDCSVCQAPSWHAGDLADELDALGIAPIFLCLGCLENRTRSAEVPADA